MKPDDIFQLRATFDQVPEIYDRARPHYPERLFDDLFTNLAEGEIQLPPRLVEIGPGPGQATGSLLSRGAKVTAVELGPALAEFLRQRYASNPNLEVITGAFEEVPLEPGSYDGIVAATAFDWVPREIRLSRAAELLRAEGTLAVIQTNQVASPIDRGYFDRTFPVYRKYRPDEPEPAARDEGLVPPEFGEVAASPLFQSAELRRYRWDQTYQTAAYIDLVRSYSSTLTMEREARESLLRDLAAIIDEEYAGLVTRPLIITLTMAKRQAYPAS